MHLEEIRKKAIQILDNDNHKNYEIETICHTEGTNVWTVQARIDNLVITLLIDNESGGLLHKEQRREFTRDVVEEPIEIHDSISVSLGLYFELTESVSVSGIKKNSVDIELIFEEQSNMLKAFRINVRNFQDTKEIMTAYQHAARLTNLITLKTGMHVFHKKPRKIINGQITDEVVGFSIGAVLTKLLNLDMTDGDLQDLLVNDSRENQQLAHFANGQKALEDADFANAIKEFYQVIEYEIPAHLSKYKFLRDGINHAELSKPHTIQELQNQFGITCIENPNSTLNPKGKYVDITSVNVQNILEKEAKYLRNEVIRIVDSKIKAQTN